MSPNLGVLYPPPTGDPTKCTFCGEPHSGFPPPLGIDDSPPIMRDLLSVLLKKFLYSHWHNRAVNRTHWKPPRGRRKATRRALRLCLLSYPSSLRSRGARRDLQEAVAPPLASLSERRVRPSQNEWTLIISLFFRRIFFLFIYFLSSHFAFPLFKQKKKTGY